MLLDNKAADVSVGWSATFVATLRCILACQSTDPDVVGKQCEFL